MDGCSVAHRPKGITMLQPRWSGSAGFFFVAPVGQADSGWGGLVRLVGWPVVQLVSGLQWFGRFGRFGRFG